MGTPKIVVFVSALALVDIINVMRLIICFAHILLFVSIFTFSTVCGKPYCTKYVLLWKIVVFSLLHCLVRFPLR